MAFVAFVVVRKQAGIPKWLSLQPEQLNLIESTSPVVTPMTTPPLTGSLSSPLVTAMADPPMRYVDGAAFDFFLIEMVNTLRASSTHAQARARKVEQEMIDAGLLPAPLPTPTTRRDHRDPSISLASKATVKPEDEEEGLRLRLEAIGMHVGANITERCVEFVLLMYYYHSVPFFQAMPWETILCGNSRHHQVCLQRPLGGMLGQASG